MRTPSQLGPSFLGRVLQAGRTRVRLRTRLREFRIGRAQHALVRAYPPQTERLVIFLVPGADGVSGGILSIVSIYEETLKLRHVHDAEVALCTLPGDPLRLKYTKIGSAPCMFSLSGMLSRLRNLKSLLIHIPECNVHDFLTKCSCWDWTRLRAIPDLRFNVMIGNIELLDPIPDLRRLGDLGAITCTTAHHAYSGPDLQERLGCPVHELSTYVSPEQYHRRPYREKEDLLVVSNDPHPQKAEILRAITATVPRVRVQVVAGLPYAQYKALIARAKWGLTFGEGLDGYFVETIFSGGVAFAVYNEIFFTEDFRGLRTVYPSYEALAQLLCSDLQDLDHGSRYVAYQAAQHSVCAKYYRYDTYVANVTSYYARHFSPARSAQRAAIVGD